MIQMRCLAVVSLILVGSCGFTSPNDDFRQRALDETIRREGLWKAQAIHNYDFNFIRSCTCDNVAVQPVRIHVRNDQITRVVGETGADVAPVAGIPWPTVDSLFLWSKQLLNDRTYAVEVSFDTVFSYPSHIQGENSQRSSVLHNSANLTVTTATAPIVVSYLIAAPASKSNKVTWRNR